jgi:uncharacterized protein YndB with AHSA1/START domain
LIRFEVSARIERPVEEVFAYVSDPENFPHWNSAVRMVRPTSAGEAAVGATYVMTRDLPTGRAENELQITALEPPHEFAIRTLSGPTPFLYRYAFGSGEGGTLLKLDAEVELPGPAAMLGAVARRAVKRGVEENFATLKQALELQPPQR